MRKRELVSAIAVETELTDGQVEAVLDATFRHLADELVAGGRFEVRDFGVFDVIARKARKLYVPKTGQTITLPARRGVRFAEFPALHARLNPEPTTPSE
jgi:nucleoid DNA-binding protein